MKTKLVFGLFALRLVQTATAITLTGSGTLILRNSENSLVYERDEFTLALTPVPVDGGRVELLWALEGTSDLNLFQTVPGQSPTRIAPLAGRFASQSLRIDGIEDGAIVSAIIRGWTGPFASWADAVASGTAKIGISDIFLVDTGNPNTVPPELPGSILNSMPGQGFTGLILAIPEPSSFALIGLGVLCLSYRLRFKKT
jgi:hypothetical protein